MDNLMDRISLEPYLRKEHQLDSLNGDIYTCQASKQSSSHKIMNESQVQGPIFSQQKFKREIDKVSAKIIEDDIQRSPIQELEAAIHFNKKKTNSSKKLPSQILSEYDQRHYNDQERLFANNGNYQSNPRIASIKHLNEEEESDQISFQQHDEMNQSFDLCDTNNIQRMQRNFSTSTKNRSHTQKQQLLPSSQTNDDQEKTGIVQGILSLGVGSNGLKKRGSAIYINQPGISVQGSQQDQRKHSIFSAYQSNQNIEFRYNDSLSPSKLNVHDLISKGGLTSEPGTPSIVKRVRNQDIPGGQMQLLNLKNASGYMTGGELSNAEKSMGDMSIKKQEGFKGVWKRSAFKILTLTKKFINNIKEQSMRYKYSQMKRHYFELIDDKANDYKSSQIERRFTNDQPNYLQIVFYRWKKVFNKKLRLDKINKQQNNFVKLMLFQLFNLDLPTLQPNQIIKIIWDCFILFLLLINLLYIPMKISFSEVTQFNSYLLVFFDDLPSWAFICDVILNFNTGYYSKGVVIKERSKIFNHQIKGPFWWDFLVVVPFFFSSVLNVKFLNIILLLRTNKILKIVTTIEELLNLKQFQTCVLNLVKLVVSIIYIAHICGCFFYYMHVLQVESDNSAFTWVIKFELQNSGWLSLYISSVYWAVITMITLGYGDIYPITSLEKTYVIIVTLISCGVFAYAVNAIGYIIQDMTRSSNEFKVKMNSLSLFMKKRDLSNTTQMVVKKYFQYLHDEQHDDNEDGQKMLLQCNSSLRNLVLTEMYGRILESRKEFRLNFSEEFLKKLAVKLRERRLGPEELIFRENEFCRRVYFVMRGNVVLQRTREISNADKKYQEDIKLKVLKKGDLFGLESFLTGSETNFCAKTQNVVSLVYLRDEDFLSVIQEFKSDKEKYFMIKDKLNLQKACRGSGISCQLCDKFSHQLLNCPYMSYQPNHRKVFLQYLKEQTQERKEYSRMAQHKTNTARADVQTVQESAIKFLFDNNPYETINELLEQIQILDDEGALQINTPDIITKYMKDPQEFDDIEDLPEDEEIDQYIKASNNDGTSNNNPMNNEYEDSVRIRRATVGSLMSKPEKQYEIHTSGVSNQFIRYGSLKANRNDNIQLEVPRREERKSSFRKQTQFSTHDQVILINNQDDTTPKRLRQINSSDTSSMKQLNSENIIHTPQLTHNVPNSPQQEKNSRYYRTHRSFKEDEESIERHTPYMNHGGNSQVSLYQLDNLRTVSIKSTKSNRYESKRDIEMNQTTNYVPHGSSFQQLNKDFMTLPTFDKAHQWVVYLPHNNLDRVVSQYSNLIEKMILDKRKRKRRTHRTLSQKQKQMQMLFSNIQARNQQKNHSKGFSRNQQTKQSFISHKDSSLNPLARNPSQLHAQSPRNENREASRSMLSQMDFPSEMPHQNGNTSQYNQKEID